MKNLVLVIVLLVSVCGFAQKKELLKDIEAVNFYGVDFSHAKVYGAKESGEQFKYAFQDINNLFITEAQKYDISKYLNKRTLGVYIEDVKARTSDIKSDNIVTTDAAYQLEDNTIKDIIKSLSIKEADGAGVIIIAERLSKAKNRGYFDVVFFDIETRNIIDSWKADGKAQGFGLRNFWAHSVLEALKFSKSALK
jgi:hypothetical protein